MKYPRPAWITNQVTWDELVKDAKFKRKVDDNPNYKPSIEGSKRRLHDTMNATKSRVSRIGSHKLGSGGYNSIRASMVSEYLIIYIQYLSNKFSSYFYCVSH